MLPKLISVKWCPSIRDIRNAAQNWGIQDVQNYCKANAGNFFHQFIVILTVAKVNWNQFLIKGNRFTFPPSGSVGRISRYLLIAFKLEILYERNYNILTEPFLSSLLLSVIRCSDQITFYITVAFSFINIQQVAPEGTYSPSMTLLFFS